MPSLLPSFPPIYPTLTVFSYRDSWYHGTRLPSSSSRRLFVVFSPSLTHPRSCRKLNVPRKARLRPCLLIRNGRFRTSWYTPYWRVSCNSRYCESATTTKTTAMTKTSKSAVLEEGGGVAFVLEPVLPDEPSRGQRDHEALDLTVDVKSTAECLCLSSIEGSSLILPIFRSTG